MLYAKCCVLSPEGRRMNKFSSFAAFKVFRGEFLISKNFRLLPLDCGRVFLHSQKIWNSLKCFNFLSTHKKEPAHRVCKFVGCLWISNKQSYPHEQQFWKFSTRLFFFVTLDWTRIENWNEREGKVRLEESLRLIGELRTFFILYAKFVVRGVVINWYESVDLLHCMKN